MRKIKIKTERTAFYLQSTMTIPENEEKEWEQYEQLATTT